MTESSLEGSLTVESPRYCAAQMLASKWKGKKGAHVFYGGKHGVNGIYEQIEDKIVIVSDMAYVSLGERIDADGSLPGELAPIRDCKLITQG